MMYDFRIDTNFDETSASKSKRNRSNKNDQDYETSPKSSIISPSSANFSHQNYNFQESLISTPLLSSSQFQQESNNSNQEELNFINNLIVNPNLFSEDSSNSSLDSFHFANNTPSESPISSLSSEESQQSLNQSPVLISNENLQFGSISTISGLINSISRNIIVSFIFHFLQIIY